MTYSKENLLEQNYLVSAPKSAPPCSRHLPHGSQWVLRISMGWSEKGSASHKSLPTPLKSPFPMLSKAESHIHFSLGILETTRLSDRVK